MHCQFFPLHSMQHKHQSLNYLSASKALSLEQGRLSLYAQSINQGALMSLTALDMPVSPYDPLAASALKICATAHYTSLSQSGLGLSFH